MQFLISNLQLLEKINQIPEKEISPTLVIPPKNV